MQIKDYGLLTRLIRTRPLFLASLLYLGGCILGYMLLPSRLLSAAAAALFVLIAILLHKRNRRFFAVLLLIAMLPLGMLRFVGYWNGFSPYDEQTGALLSGRICEMPVWNADTERTICVLEDISLDGVPHEGKLRLYLRGDPVLLQAVSLGQAVNCTAHIWRADEATNPGQFNFSNYLRLNGLRGYATAEIEKTELGAPVFIYHDTPERIREKLGARVDRLFPENAALARAFLLGDRSGLSSEERESYNKTGAAHLLAISGMHISVLAAAISIALGRFLGKRTSFFVTLALLGIYGTLIGFSASLFRAILMFAVFGLAPLAGRYSDAPTRLAAAMLIYLIVRPAAILEAGFVLSYGACAGIIFLTQPLQKLFHLDKFTFKYTDVGFVYTITNRLLHWIAQSLIVTCAAQLAILPAVVHYFGAQPLWSFAVNLLAVPLAMAAYIISIIGMLSGIVPICLVSDFLFGLLTSFVRIFSTMPVTALRIARFPAWLVLLCAAACLFSSELIKLPGKLRKVLPFTMVIAVFIANLCAYLTTLGCSIVFLDAGQADCAVLRTEGKVYMIDTGDAYTPAADYLSAMNYDLEGVFLSHPHNDHAAGLKNILEVCPPKRVYISANWNQLEIDEDVELALQMAKEMGCEIVHVSAGDEISLSDKTLLEVLSPSAGFLTASANDDSLILRMRYGETSAVFCGDAPTSVVSGKIGDIDLLKVAHHGGHNALNAHLVAETTPSVAVIPVGYNNYGHPHPETIELLKAAGTKVLRTDLCGAVTCRLNEDGSVRVQTHLASEVTNGLE